MAKSRAANTYSRIYRAVRKIPRGRVMTYGQVAKLCGMPGGARVVGYAMAACPDDVPWQRVVGKSRRYFGRISVRDSVYADIQRQLLAGEGVSFGPGGEIDLRLFGA